jgi:hypothetical protein
LILSRNPRDFHAVKPMTRALIEENRVDDHHIFPNAYLRDDLLVKETKRRDCVLNRTLIDRATNQSLSRRNPRDYFGEMAARLGESKFSELLGSHLLPTVETTALLVNDYDAFLQWRCVVIGKLIETVTS